ncbi:MAG: BNR-4 repeat-containing protein [Singulisphaera sp.]
MIERLLGSLVVGVVAAMLAGSSARVIGASEEPFVLAHDDGYRGIWYANQPTHDQYVYKYSGGMATYPHQHLPIAIYAPAVKKTFFVYGGTVPEKQELLHMVSYYDHTTGMVPRPRILLNKHTDDAHDNPTLAIDGDGYLWIFSNAHGTSRPAYVHRSALPHSIDSFVRVRKTNFSYAQPWLLPERGFLVMHTNYRQGRGLFWMTSATGENWSEPVSLAHIAQGHYQVTCSDGRRVGTAFDYHPQRGGLNARTNLYYLETTDFGQTWLTAEGDVVATPVAQVHNPALVHDYEAAGLLVYLKQLLFDAEGRPVITYLTSRGYAPGPENGPRMWHVARWTGEGWAINDLFTSDHNYDFGSLEIGAAGHWRIIAPTEPGAQPYCTGGDMVLWTSDDAGRTWKQEKQLTRDTKRNHSFARRPLAAQPDFYALWADGDAHRESGSALYFTDRKASHVWRLPERMTEEFARPEVAW